MSSGRSCIAKMVLINYEISEGTVYPTLEDGKEAVFQAMVARGESLRVKKSEKKKWVAICRDKDCFFRVRVSDVKGTGVITISRGHICPPETHADWPYARSVRFLSQHHREAVVDNRNIVPSRSRATSVWRMETAFPISRPGVLGRPSELKLKGQNWSHTKNFQH